VICRAEKDMHIDIFQNGGRTRVVAEVPEINEDDIRLDLNEDMLVLFASRGHHRYQREIRLPNAANQVVGKRVTDGILEIVLT
jgi:HSP20 family molecular chaperone IbpA